MTIPTNQTTVKPTGFAGLFARLFWMLIGNIAIVVAIAVITKYREGFLHSADVIFWVTVALLILVRYLDIKRCEGLTITGAPATIAHWRNYTVLLLILSFSSWVLAHVYAHFMSNSSGLIEKNLY